MYFTYFLVNFRRSGILFKVLLLMYIFVSLSSIFIWQSGIYNVMYLNHIITNDLHFAPFLYLFVVFIFLFIPIRAFNENKIESIVLDDKVKVEWIGRFSVVFGIGLLFLLILFVDYSAVFNNAAEIYQDSKEGELYMPVFLYRLYTFHRLLYPFILLLGFYYLAFKNEQYIKTSLLLVAAIFPRVFVSTVLVSRGGLFFLLVELMIGFLLFRNFIPKRTKRILFIGFIFVLFVLVTVVVIFTTSRFGQSAFGPLISVLKYFGESFLNFNSVFWDNIKEHPMSEFKFPFIYQLFDTPHSFVSRADRYSFFSNMTGANVLLFKTIVGDFYVEFGMVLGMSVIIIISRFFSRIIRLDINMRFSTLILYFYYYELVFIGVFDLLWHDKLLFQIILFTAMLYVFVRYKINPNPECR